MSTDAEQGTSSAPIEDKPFKPTTPADKAVVSQDVSAFREARLAERTGKPVATPKPASPADEPDDQAASTDASPVPASEPGKPSGHKGNLSTRKAELDSEIADLQNKLKFRGQLREELARLSVEPKAEPASHPAVADTTEPILAQFANEPDPYAAWVLAVSEHRSKALVETALAGERAKYQQTVADRQFTERAQTFQQRVNEAHAEDPTLAARTKIELFDYVPTSKLLANTPVTPQTDLAEGLLQTETPAVVMAHLSDHPEALARLMASATPNEFWRRFGQIERDVATPETRRPQKTITDAPRPPRTVGTRTEPLDDVEAAVRGDDMAAFKEAKLAKRRAMMR